MAEGIRTRNGKKGKTYEASVYSPRDRRKVRRTFTNLAEAKSWRRDALTALEQGRLQTAVTSTLEDAAAEYLEGMKAGTVRTKVDKRAYKPATIRAYERALRRRILPRIGHLRLSEIEREDLQGIIDAETDRGQVAANYKAGIDAVRGIYRRAIRDRIVAVNPALDLDIPRERKQRNRAITPEQAESLLAALPPEDRPVWAAAVYSGLRRGELRALRVCDVDLNLGDIEVRRNWDDFEGPISTKSEAGERTVPLLAILRNYITDQIIRTERSGEDLLFGRTADKPFIPSTVNRRANRVWKEAGLEQVSLHDLRHTYASHLIAAGINLKAISTYMGHSSIKITIDRYGHLLPGSRDEVRAAMDDYLAHAGAVRRPSDDPRHEAEVATVSGSDWRNSGRNSERLPTKPA